MQANRAIPIHMVIQKATVFPFDGSLKIFCDMIPVLNFPYEYFNKTENTPASSIPELRKSLSLIPAQNVIKVQNSDVKIK